MLVVIHSDKNQQDATTQQFAPVKVYVYKIFACFSSVYNYIVIDKISGELQKSMKS